MLHTLALVLVLAGLPAAGAEPARLDVSAKRTGGSVVITIAVPGGATASHPTLLAQPWRLYLDVAGARPAMAPVLKVDGGTVSQVRMALNRVQPPVTRVVIELTGKPVWHIERAGNGSWVQIVIGEPQATAAAPTTPALPAGTGGALIYAPPSSPAPSIDRREAIRSQLFAMRPSLEMMRAWTGPSDTELATLVAALDEISTGARAMTVSGSEADYALVAAVDAVAAAARARVRALADSTAQSKDNAITAANGALLLIESSAQKRKPEDK